MAVVVGAVQALGSSPTTNLSLVPSPSSAPSPTPDPSPAPNPAPQQIDGTSASDTLLGGVGGFAGNNLMNGKGGNDRASAGSGNDRVYGD